MMELQYAERTKRFTSSAIREMLKLADLPEVISFSGGWPAPELFPIKELQEVSHEVLETEGQLGLQYSPTEGLPALRQWIADRMNRDGGNFTMEDILITSGSQQGLDLVSKIFINAGDYIATEDPSYVGALMAFNSYEPNYIAFTMDDHGMQVDKLEASLKTTKIKMLYTIPTFQNPMGVTMSLERRKKLLELAYKYNFVILEDNPYGELRYSGENIPSLASMDTEGAVIYLGTFSKIFAPGIRLGWVATHNREALAKITQAKQAADLQTGCLVQRELAAYLSKYDIDKHIKKINDCYRERRDIMLKTMEENFPAGTTWTRPDGGLFLWVVVPEKVDINELFNTAIEQKVAFVPGSGFFPNGGGNNTMRLNFSNMQPERIREGIIRLANAIKAVL